MTAERNRRLGLALRLAPLGVLLTLGAAILATQAAARAAPAQPIPFSHQRHAEAEISCLFCHPSPLRSDVAGLPSVQKCMGCHGLIATERPAILTLADYWDRQEPIPWVRVSPSADFVFFSHQPHLSAGVSCETCHGDVAAMDAARPAVSMDMGWCLDCHLRQPEEKVARLADCLTCHD